MGHVSDIVLGYNVIKFNFFKYFTFKHHLQIEQYTSKNNFLADK